MNRHEKRSLQEIHKDFLSNLKSDTKPYSKHEQEVINAFLVDVERHKRETGANTYPRVASAFGEWKGADGFVEKVYEGEGDGKYFKLWGNTFLLKAVPDVRVLKTLDMGKSVIFQFPRRLAKEPLLALGLIGTMLLTKKRFVSLLEWIMDEILLKNVSIVESMVQYHRATLEIKRTAEHVLNAYDWGYCYPLFKKFIHFTVFFLECDRAYMLRVQDAFGTGLGLWDGLETLLSRETSEGIGHKWKFLKLILKLGLWRYGEVRTFLTQFFEQLDYAKIAMDDGDKYYSLSYISYNFGGKSFEDRMREREWIDREREHVFIKK